MSRYIYISEEYYESEGVLNICAGMPPKINAYSLIGFAVRRHLVIFRLTINYVTFLHENAIIFIEK
jgi:hypothetical protein